MDIKPDAVLVSPEYRPKTHPGDRLAGLLHEFRPMLGGAAWSIDVNGDRRLLSPVPHPTLTFPAEHAMTGRPRYRWEDRGDGVQYGFLVEEDKADA